MALRTIAGFEPQPLHGGSFLPGAHHPHCSRFDNHLLWVRGRPLCLGCVCLYSSIAAGLLMAALVPWQAVGFCAWLAGHTLLAAPTAIQPWCQKKGFKIISRTLLGAGMASYLWSGLYALPAPFAAWAFRLLVAFSLAVGFRIFSSIRKRFTYDPCSDCPLGTFPTCEWNMPRLLRENPCFLLLPIAQENGNVNVHLSAAVPNMECAVSTTAENVRKKQ
jgi:hypothetical protein